MRFSQRLGIKPVRVELEREGLSNELRNSLWTVTRDLIIDKLSNDREYNISNNGSYSPLTQFYRNLWIYFFKYPIDDLPYDFGQVDRFDASRIVRDWFFKSEWYLIFDFIEFCSSYNNKFEEISNDFLKREMSAYRFVNGKLVEINSEEEINEIKYAINNVNKFKSVKEHLKRAIELYSDRKTPDFRNSIKESISAVESLAKIIIEDDKTTLGKALKVIEKKHQIPSSLKSAFSALYGYTSGEGGIRHSLLEKGVKIDIEEARFMLITCSAFVNYLISKN